MGGPARRRLEERRNHARHRGSCLPQRRLLHRGPLPGRPGGQGPAEGRRRELIIAARPREDPSRTRQSLLTLATFRSWGIHWMTPHEGPSERLPDPAPGCEPSACGSAAPAPPLSSRTHRRVRERSREVRPEGLRCVLAGSTPRNQARVTDPTAPGWPRGWAVRYIPFSLHVVVAAWSAWRIRLVAYGARLESVLGASPRGFESPILRHHPGILVIPGFFCTLLRGPQQAPDRVSSPSTPPPAPATMAPCARKPHPSSPCQPRSFSP